MIRAWAASTRGESGKMSMNRWKLFEGVLGGGLVPVRAVALLEVALRHLQLGVVALGWDG
jgi:hypothetical protein